MGIGTFNLIMSLLPPNGFFRLLELIGVGKNKETGLNELVNLYLDKDALHQFLTSIILLGYNLVITYFLGKPTDKELCKAILEEKLAKYPKGGLFAFFQGRYHFLQGELPEAISWYKKSIDPQDKWHQLNHLAYWELLWSNLLSLNWKEAQNYSNLLFEESNWSKCTYAYQRAAILCHSQDELTQDQKETQIWLMENIPKWKQRIAGKSIPLEKFAVYKAQRFIEQGNYLVLPGIELIYAWNGFKILGQSSSLIEPIFELVEKAEAKVKQERDKPFYEDNICLVMFLKGVCLRYLKPQKAQEYFRNVIECHEKLKGDTYLVPYANYELALLLKDAGNFSEAFELLETTKKNYKDYKLK